MLVRFVTIIFFTLAAIYAAFGQTASNDPWPFPDREGRRDDESRFIREMLSKQQTEREKKEYAELIERGEDALKLSEQLERDFERTRKLSSAAIGRLHEYEKLVKKIRDDLGGDDDGETLFAVERPAPQSKRDAFKTLRNSTAWLVEEIKRSTRFSVSVAAIEGSNSLIRLARFLRIKN